MSVFQATRYALNVSGWNKYLEKSPLCIFEKNVPFFSENDFVIDKFLTIFGLNKNLKKTFHCVRLTQDAQSLSARINFLYMEKLTFLSSSVLWCAQWWLTLPKTGLHFSFHHKKTLDYFNTYLARITNEYKLIFCTKKESDRISSKKNMIWTFYSTYYV